MKYAVALPTGGPCSDPRVLVDLAVLAEASGWDAVFLEDYICFQGDPAQPACDPWIALAAMATATVRIVLGTMVTPLARRRPWKVAREVLGVDQLSDGRAVIGVGVGDTGDHVVVDTSFTAFGESADTRLRAHMLDEGLDVLAGMLTGGPFSYVGEHYTVAGVESAATSRERRVPIWVGGGYPLSGPTSRALRWDGACLYRVKGHDLRPEDVDTLRTRAGDRPYDICVGGRERGPGDLSWLRQVADAGATWWAEYIPVQDLPAMRRKLTRGPLRID
ncbi:MAG: LLM class flavin-dependent oxidoreductase [Kineosporiaceae bacterium]